MKTPAPRSSPSTARTAVDNVTLTHILTDAFTREDARRALLALEDAGDGHTRAEDLHAARRALEGVPTLTLYVPAPLAPGSVASVARWCRREIDPTLLLDIKIDRAAAGGCLFAWQGVLHDFSFTYFLRQHTRDYEALLDRVLAAPLSAPISP